MQQTLQESELYRRIKLLGEGSFGKAYLVECKADKSLCVIKQVDLSQMKEDERKETIKEARILEALRHPNIVTFREVYKTRKGRLCIVMDYADGGDLGQKIKLAGNHYLPESQILDWFTQMCLAIKHVHDRKIIHRDLKSQNIFLTKEGIIKLGDFGIARVLNHTREKCKTMVGTPYYLSPEIIDSRDYSFQTDIWSLGVILYEMCALKPPFNAESLHGLALKIVRGQYSPLPDRYSIEVKQMVGALLNVDPSKRPTIHQVLKMPAMVNRIRKVLSESIRNVEFSHTILHKQRFVNHDLEIPFENELNRKKIQQQFKVGDIQQQQHQQPSTYLQVLQNNNINKGNNIKSQLQKQQLIYQQHQPINNFDYFSKQQNQQPNQQQVYPANYQPRYQPYRYNILQPKPTWEKYLGDNNRDRSPYQQRDQLSKWEIPRKNNYKEVNQVEPIKLEAQKIEQPKLEQPRLDQLKIEQPKIEQVKVEQKQKQYSPLDQRLREQQQQEYFLQREPQSQPVLSNKVNQDMKESHLILRQIQDEKKKKSSQDKENIEDDNDDAQIILQELEDIIITADQDVNQSEVVNVNEEDICLMTQSNDSSVREDDESILDESDERIELDDDFEEEEFYRKSVSEHLKNILVEEIGSQRLNEELKRIEQLSGTDYLNSLKGQYEQEWMQVIYIYESIINSN